MPRTINLAMKYTLLPFALCLSCFIQAQSVADLDQKNGYKDITFNMPFDSLQKVLKIKKAPYQDKDIDAPRYVINEKKYSSIADIPVEAQLQVYDNRILSVVLKLESWAKQGDELVKIFTELYGKPEKLVSIDESYLWKGAEVELYASELTYGMGMIIILSTANQQYYEGKLKEKAKNKSADF